MIKVTKTVERPDNSVPWNKALTSEVLTVINEYIDNQQLLGRTQTLNNNTNTTTSIWASQDDYNSYLNDPRLSTWLHALDEHRAQYNIIMTVDSLSTISEHDQDYQQYVGIFKIIDGAGQNIPVGTFMK
jgi:hypothetical protein